VAGSERCLWAVVCPARCVGNSGSLSLPIAAVVLSLALNVVGVLGAPLPIAAAGVGSSSLSILGVLALALAIAAILSALLVPVLPLPTTVILGQSLGILPVPLTHASLALRIAAVPPRAIPAELRSRLLLSALAAALQVARVSHGKPRYALASRGRQPGSRSGVRSGALGTRSLVSRGDEMGVLRGLGRAVGGLLAGVFGLLRGLLQGVGSLLRRLF
jgi:hypothetical protein